MYAVTAADAAELIPARITVFIIFFIYNLYRNQGAKGENPFIINELDVLRVSSERFLVRNTFSSVQFAIRKVQDGF